MLLWAVGNCNRPEVKFQESPTSQEHDTAGLNWSLVFNHENHFSVFKEAAECVGYKLLHATDLPLNTASPRLVLHTLTKRKVFYAPDH